MPKSEEDKKKFHSVKIESELYFKLKQQSAVKFKSISAQISKALEDQEKLATYRAFVETIRCSSLEWVGINGTLEKTPVEEIIKKIFP